MVSTSFTPNVRRHILKEISGMANKPVRRLVGSAAIVSVAMLFASIAKAQDIKPPYTNTPPKHLKKVGDHWTPYDPPSSFPEGAKVYIIVQGDTLWDLSKANLGDPYLWPKIWEANQYILDAHWIYPGDPLVIPDLAAVDSGLPGEPSAEGPVGGKNPVPVAFDWDVQCSGFISKDFESLAKIIEVFNGDEGQIGASTPDVIYSTNPDKKIQAGTDYQVLRGVEDVYHPETGDHLGKYYRLLGRARAICTSEKSATLELIDACSDIVVGDKLRIWEEVPIPIADVYTMERIDRWCQEPSGKLKGYIVYATDDLMAMAEGHVVHLDVGSDDNIAPGDFFTIYKSYHSDYYELAGWKSDRTPKGDYADEDLPRQVLGELVVLMTEKHTATARITTTAKQVEIGSRVELVAR
jgi:hypothetical protein